MIRSVFSRTPSLRCCSAVASLPTITTTTTPSTAWSTIQSRSLFGLGGDDSPQDVDIEAESMRIYNDILSPLNSSTLGPLERYSDQLTPMPMVFVLGNHSSGKSTFLNHVLGRDIQKTGVAPTDDAFTIICPGGKDADQDGPALIGDPDLGFNGLRHFGTSLMNSVNLKVRTDLNIDNIMVVDSPGMIDSPGMTMGGTSPQNANDFMYNDSNATRRDRGYHFPEVVRWFAQRADVILLFFDPDKPGTTGETLACMTHSLSGLDHKVHIILNKVDQFRKVHDFARAYGSLCWNLSKVIPRKDLPRIYTMCVPVEQSEATTPLVEAMGDLQLAREEIIDEVRNAPLRRLDNVITRLDDSTRLLRLYASVLDRARQEYKSIALRWNLATAAAFVGGGALAGTSLMAGLWEVSIPLAVLGVGGSGGLWWMGQRALTDKTEQLTKRGGLDEVFRKVHYLQLAENDDFVVALWERVRPQLKRAIETVGLAKLPSVSSSDIRRLTNVLENDVPSFRRQNTRGSVFINSTKVEDAKQAVDMLAASGHDPTA